MPDGQLPAPPPSRRADGFLFLTLALLALVGFAPCILLPEWKQWEALWVAEQHQLHHVQKLERAITHEKRLLEAMSSDPAVVARVAQRDLSLNRRDERAVLITIAEPEPRHEEFFVAVGLPTPAPIAKLAERLPPYDYAGLFCENRTRIPIMALSASLLAVAFALFAKRPV